ncbi:MAG: SusC/RagA family TonB-linked outer membrane protein [Gemmatimonadetes bacterium]|nr:SusC/RagA family TonB-linked outer membrane protein [Gemmatimonadota bacterium]
MRWSLVCAAAFALLAAERASAQTRIITGRVTDSLTSEVVTSGQVSVTGTTVGSTIKEDGTFTLAAPTRDVTVVVRSIGFKRVDVAVPASQSAVDVALARDYFQLEAIVVTGQATGVERKNLANAVASVDNQTLVKSSTSSVEQALMGKVAGAQIQDYGSGPGGGVIVTLRGANSLNNAYTPLYVVDGVVVSDAKISPGINRLTRATSATLISSDQEYPVNRIGDLNPNEIESIEVLKGASASAIYGSKASNGVILITTKKGRVGTPQFTVSQRFGTSRIMRKVGGRVFETEAEAIAAFGPTASQYWTPTVYDHDEELAGRRPLSYETAATVSGGTETTRYFASGLVRHEGAIIRVEYANKQSLRLNLDQQIGRRLSLNLSSEAIHTGNDRGINGNGNAGVVYYDALTSTPSFVDLRAVCPDGSRQIRCKGGVYPNNPYANSNPLASVEYVKNEESVWRMILSGRANWDVISSPQHSLRLIGIGGVDYFSQKNVVFSPPFMQFEPLDGFLGTSVLSNGGNANQNVTGSTVYTYKPASGAFSATTSAGIQYETRNLQVQRTLSENLVGGLQITTAGTNVRLDEEFEKVNDLGFYGQEEFLLGDRLLLTAGARADQSSNNSDASKLYFYPKASASYRLTTPLLAVDELKLRAAFGASGNQPSYRQRFSELASVNIAGVPAFNISSTVAANDIRPERQREIEVGLDATLFKSRANLEVTGFEKRISDLLLRRSIAPVMGFGTQVFNGGVMRTRGLEVGLNMIPIQSQKVQWNPRVNFFMSRSKVLSLPVPTFRQSGSARYGTLQIETGKSPTQVIAWIPSVAGSATSPRTDGVIGDYNPDYKLGFGNDLKIGQFNVYFLLDHYQGGWIHNYTELLYDFSLNTRDYEDPVPAGSPLAPYGTQMGAARIAAGQSNCSTCAWVQPMTYTKLREATLSFELPASFVRSLWSGARYMRLSLSGRNLLILTGYRGQDPEVLARAATVWTQWRSDIWPHPTYRTFWLSVDVGF